MVMAYFCTLIVGAVFLVTGFIKSLNSVQFIQHISKYRLLPPWVVLSVAISFIGLECALGVALVFYEFHQWLVPGSIILLFCLSALTLWSTFSGRTEDCGCYGGLLIITPQQSILLNLGYIFLLGLAAFYPVTNHQTETWQWILVLIVLLCTSTLSWLSRQEAIVDFSRLKIGNRWKCHWLKESPTDLQQGRHFVVFISPNCPICKGWIPFLNVMMTQEDFPNVMGIMSLPPETLEEFKVEQEVYFPLVSMNKRLFDFMVDAYPTAILIEDGIISNQWIGKVPDEFLDRVIQLYEQAMAKQM